MTGITELDQRLEFLELRVQDREIVRQFFPVLRPHLVGILEQFYDKLRRIPHLAAMFGEGARQAAIMRHAAEAQARHWENLFSGRYDDAYVASVRKIGLTHARIGLEPRWYLGGYSFVMNHLYRLASHHYLSRFHPKTAQDKTEALLQAVSKAVMLDMDLAVSVYLDENKRTYAERLQKVSDDFRTSVMEVVMRVGDAAKTMRSDADNLTSAVGDTKDASLIVASATEEAATNVQSVAGATEQLTASSREIGMQMTHSAATAKDAVTEAHRASATVEHLLRATNKSAPSLR